MSLLNSVGRRLALAGVICLFAAGLALAQAARPQTGLKVEPLVIDTARGPVRFQVEIADTPKKREIGMMHRTWIAPDRGMLFDFPRSEAASFWMKNTFIPLDILFIDKDGHILSVARNARPLDETPIQSHGFSRGVLEIGGGRAAQLGIQPGDRVHHRIFPR